MKSVIRAFQLLKRKIQWGGVQENIVLPTENVSYEDLIAALGKSVGIADPGKVGQQLLYEFGFISKPVERHTIFLSGQYTHNGFIRDGGSTKTTNQFIRAVSFDEGINSGKVFYPNKDGSFSIKKTK
jgi:hypothetical protein